MPDIQSSDISIVLVEPTEPGNVGSVARAMDNMGIQDLRLVRPCEYFHPKARMFAMNARYLLRQATPVVVPPGSAIGSTGLPEGDHYP